MRFAYFIFGTGLLILCMLLIHRFLYRKLTPGKLYALWLIPALRLLIPFGWLEMPQTDITGKVLGTPYRLMAELFSEKTKKKAIAIFYRAAYFCFKVCRISEIDL